MRARVIVVLAGWVSACQVSEIIIPTASDASSGSGAQDGGMSSPDAAPPSPDSGLPSPDGGPPERDGGEAADAGFATVVMTPGLVPTPNTWVADCGPEVVEVRGLRTRLLIAPVAFDRFSSRRLRDFVALSDAFHLRLEAIFGWHFFPGAPGYDVALCDTGGLGTGTQGTGWPLVYFGAVPAAWIDGLSSESDWILGLMHEHVHLWDYRGGYYLQSDDPAHAFTDAFEYYLPFSLGFNYLNDYSRAPIDAETGFHIVLQQHLHRYFKSPDLNWSTYFGPEGVVASNRGRPEPQPEQRERLTVQGGLFLHLMRWFGEDRMRDLWAPINELRRRQEPQGETPTSLNERFYTLLYRDLKVDPRPIYDRFRYPYPSSSLPGIMPLDPIQVDGDRDGFRPLDGDWDDADPTRYPGAVERMDGLDNDFDGLVDNEVRVEVSDWPSEPSGEPASLPLRLQGRIASLTDQDAHAIQIAEKTLVSLVAFRDDNSGPVTETESGRMNGLQGVVSFGRVFARLWGGTSVSASAWLLPGTHTLRIFVPEGDEERNPGTYRILVFANRTALAPIETPYGPYIHKRDLTRRPDVDFSCDRVVDVSTGECEALIELWRRRRGSWIDEENWLSFEEACYWDGVYCNRFGVEMLSLGEGRDVEGVPPGLWSAFRHLKRLDTGTLSGPIPAGLLELEIERLRHGGRLCVSTARERAWVQGLTYVDEPLADCD